MMKQHLKIVIVGPPKSGKTTFADLVCSDPKKEKEKSQRRAYEPTLCRILETVALDGIKIEMWDIGGSSDHEHLWKPIMQGIDADGKASDTRVDGVIIVLDNDQKNHYQEALLWYNKFVRECNVPDKCCMVLCRSREGKNRSGVPRQLQGCRVHGTSLVDGEEAKLFVEDFVNDIVTMRQ